MWSQKEEREGEGSTLYSSLPQSTHSPTGSSRTIGQRSAASEQLSPADALFLSLAAAASGSLPFCHSAGKKAAANGKVASRNGAPPTSSLVPMAHSHTSSQLTDVRAQRSSTSSACAAPLRMDGTAAAASLWEISG